MMNDADKFRDIEEQNTQNRAQMLGMQYLDSRRFDHNQPLVNSVLNINDMRNGHMVVLSDPGENSPLIFGVTISTPQQLLRELREKYVDRVLQFMMISTSGYKELMLRYDPPTKPKYEDVKIAKEGDSDTITQVSQTLSAVRSDDMLSYLITQADKLTASDIHLECQRNGVRIRMRIDGVLHPVANLTYDKYRVLFAAIATSANVSTADRNPQTGHMQKDIKAADGSVRVLNMRIETVPTVYGQEAVIRLFNFDSSMLKLESLGLSEEQFNAFEEVVKHPRGMVLMVGPTGSGKSTTLYSMINALNDPSRKILTLEDPVEFSVPGVSQIPVDTSDGDSFADKLRAVLRLDPDVVMIGEIRDADTARTAIQASITGHLVLSTFHASTTAAAFSRMVDMIGQNPIFSTAIRMVVGQRLVRKLDDDTKIAYKPDEATVAYISRVLEDLPERVAKPDLSNITLYRPGKSEAAPFGFTGRIVLLEQMMVSENIQKFLRGDEKDVHAQAIEDAAKREGMVTLLQDGVLKALAGVTTLEEVEKVI